MSFLGVLEQSQNILLSDQLIFTYILFMGNNKKDPHNKPLITYHTTFPYISFNSNPLYNDKWEKLGFIALKHKNFLSNPIGACACVTSKLSGLHMDGLQLLISPRINA